jgi:hypothetical protein
MRLIVSELAFVLRLAIAHQIQTLAILLVIDPGC